MTEVRCEPLGEILDSVGPDLGRLVGAETAVEPFMDEVWLSAYLECGARGKVWAVSCWEAAELVGLAPLDIRCEWWYGLPVRVAYSLTFHWLNRFEFLARERSALLVERMWDEWYASNRFDIVLLDILPADSPTLSVGMSAASRHGYRIWSSAIYASPFCRLPNHVSAWDQKLKPKFKANLRNRERRLAHLGEVTFEVVQGGPDLSRAMEVFYRLEATGWKADRGTAILNNPEIKSFYDRLADHPESSVVVTVLRLSDRPIAAQLYRRGRQALYLLKVGYDPEFSPLSPGQLLTRRSIQYAIEQGLSEFDFLGESMTWKADWSPTERPLSTMYAYGGTLRGRSAYWIHTGWKQVGRRWRDRLRGV